MKNQSEYQKQLGYAKVTLTSSGYAVRALAKERKWSLAQTADYLITLGAKTLNLKGVQTVSELR